MDGDIDLDAYFARIGYDGPRQPTLAVLRALHRLHPEAIPFESLDPLFGRPVLIDAASLERKLVRGSRGGYCFEQNGVFFRVLRSLGFTVTPLSARVGWMLPQDAPRPPLSHMLVRVDLPEGPFLADVGFGGQSPTAPLRMVADLEQSTSHGDYRFLADDDALALQMRLPDRWETLYRFTQAPQGTADYEVANWFTSTHPASRFTVNLVAARVDGARRLNLFNRDLTAYESDGRSETRRLSGPGEIHEALTRDFHLEVERGEIERVLDRLPPSES
jgi:N-hydroxyarylamine O-acetyltransferase